MPLLVLIRMKGSGITVAVLPAIAIARVNGGTAEYFECPEGLAPETAAVEPRAQIAVSAAQHPPKKKPAR
jgi:hypothetical protein